MRTNIVTRGFENAQVLHEYIRYRLSFALGRTGKADRGTLRKQFEERKQRESSC